MTAQRGDFDRPPTDRVTVSLPAEDVAFLRGFDPDRDRTASRADMVRVIEHLQAALVDQPAPGTDGGGQAVQRVLDPWEDNRSRGFDCEPCRGTGRVPLLGMPDGSEAARTCLDCDGTGRAAVAGPQRDHDEEGATTSTPQAQPTPDLMDNLRRSLTDARSEWRDR